MSSRTEGLLAIFAALLVLFTAMLNPLVSTAIAIVALVTLGIFHITRQRP